MNLPQVVSVAEWQSAHETLLAEEKEATKARDALAAKRRRQPMVRIEKNYVFDGPGGNASLLDLFDGRRQLILYHFMFAPGRSGLAVGGLRRLLDVRRPDRPPRPYARTRHLLRPGVPCSTPGHRALQAAHGLVRSVVLVLRNRLNVDFGMTTDEGEAFGLSILLRDGDDVFRTYFTSGRGVEALGSAWTFLDLTPLGRQEAWEDSPADPQQTTPWRRHDEYRRAG